MLVPKGIQRRPEEGPATTMPLLGVFFSVESFSCPSERDLGWSYLQLRKPAGRLGYQFKRIGQGRTAAEGWRWFDIVTMETRTWWGVWWGSSGELLNSGGVEACAHVGEPSSETSWSLLNSSLISTLTWQLLDSQALCLSPLIISSHVDP